MLRTLFPLAAASTDPFVTAVTNFFTYLISVGQSVALVVAVFSVIVAGLLWATSNGNTRQIERAKGALIAAGIGFFIVMVAHTLAQVLQNAIPTGVN